MMVELFVGTLRHVPPELGMRFDPRKFRECISGIVDNTRSYPSEWPFGPGWSTADVDVGTDYKKILQDNFGVSDISQLSIEQKFMLRNSDDPNASAGFNNNSRLKAIEEWKRYTEDAVMFTPLAACAEAPTREKMAREFVCLS